MATAPPNSPSPYAPRPAAPSRNMLAWWGVFPAIVFAAIKCFFGWKYAQARASGPSFVVSYWMGGLLGGFVIAALIAWITYRALGRSQVAGTVAFTIVLAFATLSVVNQAITARSPQQGAALASDKPTFASFGDFGFEIPAGWQSAPPEHDDQRAYLLLNSNDWRKADGRIDVDVGTPARPTARQLARSVAGKEGKVRPEAVFVDGIEGARVDMPSPDVSQPRYCAIVFRDGQAYLIFAAQSPGHDVSEAFEHVLKTWSWKTAKKQS